MRFYWILLLSLLFSCGTSRIKKVPVHHAEREIVEETITSESATGPVSNQELFADIDEKLLLIKTDEPALHNFKQGEKSDVIVRIEDDPEISKEAKLVAALQTEKKAKTSKNLLLSSFIITLLSWLFPPILVVSLVLFTVGTVKYSRAKNERFITLEGERSLKKAKDLVLANAILMSLIVLLIGGLILFLFL